jgi:hypothetical protein
VIAPKDGETKSGRCYRRVNRLTCDGRTATITAPQIVAIGLACVEGRIAMTHRSVLRAAVPLMALAAAATLGGCVAYPAYPGYPGYVAYPAYGPAYGYGYGPYYGGGYVGVGGGWHDGGGGWRR